MNYVTVILKGSGRQYNGELIKLYPTQVIILDKILGEITIELSEIAVRRGF